MPGYIPDGYSALTSRIFVVDPAAMVAFLVAAFEATGELIGDRPAEMRVGGDLLLVGGTQVRQPTSSAFYLYVPDADTTYARSIAAGASSMEVPGNTPYGDRRAMVADPFGNTWQIATRRSAN